MAGLAYLGATEALERFRKKDLSPVDLLDAVIARTGEAEPHINAFTDTFFEEAREQAHRSADAHTRGTARPLEGIPVAIKDETAVAGQRLAMGSMLFADNVADHTDPIAQRLIDAGAIVHARSAAPEFSMAPVTWSYLHGISRNPWNLEISCGGSSGGAGAGLAAGMTTLANGSDIGGSIRIPSSLNGVTGFKPPWGRVPEYWPWNREPYASGGAMARSVADVVLMMNVVSGPLVGDMYSLPRLDLPGSFAPVAGMKIALSRDLGYFEPEDDVVAALERAADVLRGLDVTVDAVDLGWDERAADTAMTHLQFQSGTVLRGSVPQDRWGDLTPYIQDFLGGDPVSPERWIDSWQYADEMYRRLQEAVFLAGYDALICPTLTTTAIPADMGHPEGSGSLVLGEELALMMTYPFNTLGRLPVANVPIGMASGTGVPIGMQIVGPKDQDPVPLRIAAALEQAEGRLFDRVRPELP